MPRQSEAGTTINRRPHVHAHAQAQGSRSRSRWLRRGAVGPLEAAQRPLRRGSSRLAARDRVVSSNVSSTSPVPESHTYLFSKRSGAYESGTT